MSFHELTYQMVVKQDNIVKYLAQCWQILCDTYWLLLSVTFLPQQVCIGRTAQVIQHPNVLHIKYFITKMLRCMAF